MTNIFAIQPKKVLNKEFNQLTIWGQIPLFSDNFSVTATLNISADGNNGPANNAGSFSDNLTFDKSEVADLSDATIVKAVATKLGVVLK